jgi:hypothetical protein
MFLEKARLAEADTFALTACVDTVIVQARFATTLQKTRQLRDHHVYLRPLLPLVCVP